MTNDYLQAALRTELQGDGLWETLKGRLLLHLDELSSHFSREYTKKARWKDLKQKLASALLSQKKPAEFVAKAVADVCWRINP